MNVLSDKFMGKKRKATFAAPHDNQPGAKVGKKTEGTKFQNHFFYGGLMYGEDCN